MHIPSFKLISQSMLKKSPENSDGRTDGRTDGQTDGHCHSIIRPFFKRAYKNQISSWHRMADVRLDNQNSILSTSLPYRHGILLPISKRYQNGNVMSDLPIWISDIYLTYNGGRGINRGIPSYQYRYDIGHCIDIEWFMSFCAGNGLSHIQR